jgi:predicted DNA-binding transcriptional regulator YafY
LEDASLSALSKLEHVLPPRLRGRLEDVSEATVTTAGRSSSRVDHNALATVASAIRAGVRIRFAYVDAEGRLRPGSRRLEDLPPRSGRRPGSHRDALGPAQGA